VKYFGTLLTKEDYANYHLKLKFKWGEKKYEPRANLKRDSGILFHGFGDPGAVNKRWITSHELQIQEGDNGDYYAVGDVSLDIPAKAVDDLHVFDPDSELVTFTNMRSFRRCQKSQDVEKPHGEWNDIELICSGDSCIFIVNNTVVLRGYNSSRVVEGVKEKLTSGKIAIQSEGAEVYYKDVRIKRI
jgi:hypothetical protein